MKFKVKRASDIGSGREMTFEKEFDSLTDIKEFTLKYCNACIIYWEEMELLIYDDWIE